MTIDKKFIGKFVNVSSKAALASYFLVVINFLAKNGNSKAPGTLNTIILSLFSPLSSKAFVHPKRSPSVILELNSLSAIAMFVNLSNAPVLFFLSPDNAYLYH